jgi:hypothetical protein
LQTGGQELLVRPELSPSAFGQSWHGLTQGGAFSARVRMGSSLAMSRLDVFGPVRALGVAIRRPHRRRRRCGSRSAPLPRP